MYKTEYSINSAYNANKSTFLDVCSKKQQSIVEDFIELFTPVNNERFNSIYFSLYRYDKNKGYKLTISTM